MASSHLRVRLSPRSSRNELVRYEDGTLYVRVTAPPVEGAANAALIALLSDALGVRKSTVEIVLGASSREKKVSIEGIDDADLQARIAKALGGY